MISSEDCEFIKKFEVATSEEKQVILTNEGHQVLEALKISVTCCVSHPVHASQFLDLFTVLRITNQTDNHLH